VHYDGIFRSGFTEFIIKVQDCIKVVHLSKNNMTIKQKIVKITKELRGLLKKDGKNSFANYNYFLPDEILSTLNPLLENNELFMSFNMPYSNDKKMYEATLYFEDLTDETQNITYKFDIPLTSVKGASEAQGAGATLTYAKRYSLMNVFSIADNNDDLDSKNPAVFEKTQQKETKKEDFSPDHKCSKCSGPTYYREGTSKKGNKYKGYKCADNKCDNFDFISDFATENGMSFEAKLRQAHNEADMQKEHNDSIPVINEDSEYGA